MGLSRRDFLQKSAILGIGGVVASSPIRLLAMADKSPDLIVVQGPDPGAITAKAIAAAGGI